jgi:CheY-like chemotaxis protein
MVVLDLNMPVMDGFETCKRLRRQQWARDALFIAYSGMPAPRAAALAAGFDRVVSKGDSPDVFETILNGLVDT